MKKTSPYLIMMVLMLFAFGCKQQTREQITKEVNSRIEKMTVNRLQYPDSYEPISTDISIEKNDKIIYDSDAFSALRDLSQNYDNFREKCGNDYTSEEARDKLNTLKSIVNVLCDRINVINNNPGDLECINAYHQFYANDRSGQKVKKGYHYIIHKDKSITLLCDHEEFLRIQTFAMKLLNEPPYTCPWDSVEQELFSPIAKAWKSGEANSK